MDEVIAAIKSKNINLLTHQHMMMGGDSSNDSDLLKGKPAAEGEIREWKGRKFRKQGGKWVEVHPTRKNAPVTAKKQDTSPAKPATQGQGPSPKKPAQTPPVPTADLGNLSRMKKLIESGDVGRASQIADNLSDQGKNIIPPQVWSQIHEHRDKKDVKQQKQIDKPTKGEQNHDTIEDHNKKGMKGWVAKNKALFDTREHAHPDRSAASKFLRGKMKGLIRGIKHEVDHIKHAGISIKKVLTGQKLSKHEKQAIKKVGISLGLTVGTMLATGGLSAFTHGAIPALQHIGIHFVEHGLLETAGLSAIFAKAVEDQINNDEVDEQDLQKLTDHFITYIEHGDWSKIMDDSTEK